MLTSTKENNLMTKYGLSGNILKILACGFMLLDHIGYQFFPRGMLLRIVGRLALPIFGYLVAEGCKYTKNKPKHLLLFLLTSVLYTTVYWFVDGRLYGTILTTFSLSSLIIFALQFFKKNVAKGNVELSLAGFLMTAAAVVFAVLMCETMTVDYGISGVLLPVFVSLADMRDFKNLRLSFYGQRAVELCLLACGICLLVYARTPLSGIAHWHFLSLVFIALYSSQRGYVKMKYFFHVFYPLHLVLIYGVWYLMRLI